jgi:hypothetical protein
MPTGKFVSMKKKKLTDKERKSEMVADYPRDEYPYGLRIDLNEESLKRLKLSAANFKVKEEFVIYAKVKTSSVSSRDSDVRGSNDNVELQITGLDMGMKPKKSAFDSYQEANDKMGGVI